MPGLVCWYRFCDFVVNKIASHLPIEDRPMLTLTETVLALVQKLNINFEMLVTCALTSRNTVAGHF